MKKVLMVLAILFLFVGCDMGINNTPTKKVEEFLNKYQTLDDDLLNNLDYSIESNALTEEQKSMYRNIMKMQYKDLTYEVKEEKVDGDSATVTVEIEVYDYNKANQQASSYFTANQNEFLNEDGSVNETKFLDYRLGLMNNLKDRVKYTLEFSATKKDDKWFLDDITEDMIQKINGIYSY